MTDTNSLSSQDLTLKDSHSSSSSPESASYKLSPISDSCDQIGDLYKQKKERIIVYEPKRQYEPILSHNRLIQSHLAIKNFGDKLSKARSEVAILDLSDNSDVTETESSGKTKSSKEQLETSDGMDHEVDHCSEMIPEWMTPSKTKSKKEMRNGLDCVERLRKFYIFDGIPIINKLYNNDNYTTNCVTIRNADYQQLFFVAPDGNRGISKQLPYSLRFVDQYNRHIVTIRKQCKCFCAEINAKIECPPGVTIGVFKEKRHWFSSAIEFVIIDPKLNKTRFTIKKSTDTTVSYEFEILNSINDSIGTIAKRFDKILLNNVLKEDHCIRVAVPHTFTVNEKLLIISAAIVINYYYLKNYTIK